MKTHCIRQGLLAGVAVLASMTASASYIDHDFDSAPFTLGATFTTAIQGWRATTPSVVVTNDKAYAGQSVRLSEGSTFSNTVAQSANVVWTDLRIAPTLGLEPDPSFTNGVSFLSYFGTNGYLYVWSGSAWWVCSNDVGNLSVPAATNGVFAELSIYQNFTTHRAAILVNDRVVLQDLPFSSAVSTYNVLGVRCASSNAWLDDAYVQTNYAAGRLTSNNNGVDGADASELQVFGYVARTLVVGTGPYAYSNLTSALAVARDRDTLSVDCGAQYAETVTITQSLTIAGCTFTNTGTLTVAAGKTVTVATNFTSSLIVNGTLALAQGVVVSGEVVTVAGSITGLTNNTQLLAGNLDVTGSGTVVATGGQVSDAGVVVGLIGTFTLSNTWDNVATEAGLDFIDDFEQYTADTRVQGLGFRGWGASSAGVVVKDAPQGYAGSKGVLLSGAGLISNRIATLETKIWTDFRLKPVPGGEPPSIATNTMAFFGYVAANGFMNIWSDGAWVACTNYINGSNVTAMTTGDYTRVTAFLNFGSHKAAVFVDGKLSRQLVGFPAAAGISNYSGFRALNTGNNAYLDSVRITASAPLDLLTVSAATDLDGDDGADAYEIQQFDSHLVWRGPRTVFKFQ